MLAGFLNRMQRRAMRFPRFSTLAIVLLIASPASAQQKARLVEVLRFGGDAEGPASVASVRALAVKDDGSIFVVDAKPLQLKGFSSDGKYLRDIGRWGAGPGEYKDVSYLTVNRAGNVVLLDLELRRLVVFTPDGRHVSTSQVSGLSCCRLDGVVTADGTILSEASVRDKGGKLRDVIVRIRNYGRITDTLPFPTCGNANPTTPRYARLKTEQGWMGYAIPFVSQPVHAIAGDETIWCTPGHQFSVQHFAAGSINAMHHVQRPIQPTPLTSQDRTRAANGVKNATLEDGTPITSAHLPKTYPVIDRMMVDYDNRLWIVRGGPRGAAPSFEVLDRTGRGLYSIGTDLRWLGIPHARGAFVYGVALDDDDVSHIIKARIEPIR